MTVEKVIPILRIFDYRKAIEFYVDWLGFKIEWEHTFEDNTPVYMEITRDGIALHLSEHHGDATPGARGAACYMENTSSCLFKNSFSINSSLGSNASNCLIFSWKPLLFFMIATLALRTNSINP